VPTAGTASAAAGVVSLVLLTAAVVLGVLVTRRRVLPPGSRYAVLRWHQNVSLLAVALVAVHVLVALGASFAGLSLVAAFLPFAAPRAGLWIGLGAISFDLMIALTVTSLARRRLGRRAFRAVHWLAYACWPAAVAHSIWTGPGMRSGRLLDLALGCVLAVAVAVAWRLAAPLRARRPARPAPAAQLAGQPAGRPARAEAQASDPRPNDPA